MGSSNLINYLTSMCYIYIYICWIPLAPLEPTTGVLWVPGVYAYIIISLFWRFWGLGGGIWGFEDGELGEWLMCEKASLVRHFSRCLLTLAFHGEEGKWSLCPKVCGGILTPPLHSAAAPPMCYLYEWVECFFRFYGASKESRSMPCGRQGKGILNSACARLSRAVPSLW